MRGHGRDKERVRSNAPGIDAFGVSVSETIARGLPATGADLSGFTRPNQLGFRPILQVLEVSGISDTTTVGSAVLGPIGGRCRQRGYACDGHHRKYQKEVSHAGHRNVFHSFCRATSVSTCRNWLSAALNPLACRLTRMPACRSSAGFS